MSGKRMASALTELCASRLLGPFLEGVRDRFGAYELLEHWQQGEFWERKPT